MTAGGRVDPQGLPVSVSTRGLNAPSLEKESVSLGKTDTQIPQLVQDEPSLSIVCCLSEYYITSIPTWKLREHSLQAMHLSFATI